MASDKGYLEYIMEQLSALEGVSYKAMMGEYIIYYKGRIAGGIYDDRLLVKQTAAAERLIPNAPRELPYEGGKPMLLVEDVDDSDFLCRLIDEMYDGLPEPRKRK